MKKYIKWSRTSNFFDAKVVLYFALGVSFTILSLWIYWQAASVIPLVISLLILIALGGVFGWVLFRTFLNFRKEPIDQQRPSFRSVLKRTSENLKQEHLWAKELLDLVDEFWTPITFISSIVLVIWVFGSLIGLADLMISSVGLKSSQQQATETRKASRLNAQIEVAALSSRIQPLELIESDWRSLGLYGQAGPKDHLSEFSCEDKAIGQHICEVISLQADREQVLLKYGLAFESAARERKINADFHLGSVSEGHLGLNENEITRFEGEVFFQDMSLKCSVPEKLRLIAKASYDKLRRLELEFSSWVSRNQGGALQGINLAKVSNLYLVDDGSEEFLKQAHLDYIVSTNILIETYNFCHQRLSQLRKIRNGFVTEFDLEPLSTAPPLEYIQKSAYEIDPFRSINEPTKTTKDPKVEALKDSGIFAED